MSTLRASKLPLLTKCSGSLYIPNNETETENMKKGSEWGKMVHYWKETGEIHGPDKRTENAFRKAISVSNINRHTLWPIDGVHEQGVKLALDGSRRVHILHASPTPEAGWLTGTDDFQWWLYGDLWIDDLKTGKAYPDEHGVNRFPQDPRSTQLRAYALAVATVLEHRGDCQVSITHWPRLPLAARRSAPHRLWTTYTRPELDAFWPELERVGEEYAKGLQGEYTLHPGDHCRFCPARQACLEAKTDF